MACIGGSVTDPYVQGAQALAAATASDTQGTLLCAGTTSRCSSSRTSARMEPRSAPHAGRGTAGTASCWLVQPCQLTQLHPSRRPAAGLSPGCHIVAKRRARCLPARSDGLLQQGWSALACTTAFVFRRGAKHAAGQCTNQPTSATKFTRARLHKQGCTDTQRQQHGLPAL
jgi:hypothetical protein